MPILFLLILIAGQQSGCCRKSFSYPVMANVVRIEVTKDKVMMKEIGDAATIDSIVRFIDERRSRWCSPVSGVPPVSSTLILHKSHGGPGEIGLGKGFFVAHLADGKYVLEISPKERQAFFKLLEVEEDRIY